MTNIIVALIIVALIIVTLIIVTLGCCVKAPLG